MQRLQAFDRGLSPLEDSLAQLELYTKYDFVAEERGFLLWQRSSKAGGPTGVGEAVWQTEAKWGQPVSLPIRPGRALWLAVKVRRSASGWLKHQLLLTPVDPTLVLRDENGNPISAMELFGPASVTNSNGKSVSAQIDYSRLYTP